MKRYQAKRFKEENSSDWDTNVSLRKYYNSSERLTTKREIVEDLVQLELEDLDREQNRLDLRHHLDRKMENIHYALFATFRRFKIAKDEDHYHYNDHWYHEDDWHRFVEVDISLDEILRRLAL